MEIEVGKVTHYYNRIGVAVLSLCERVQVGDTIHLLGRVTDFIQRVESLEIEHRKVPSAGPGEDVALKVEAPVREGDTVFRVVAEAE